MSWSNTLKKADSYFPPEALQQKVNEIQTQIGSIRSLEDLYRFILGLKGSGLAAEAWEKNAQGRFSLQDQIRTLQQMPIEALFKEITRQVPGMLSYNFSEEQISQQVLKPLSKRFSSTFGLRDKALALMKPHMGNAIRAARTQPMNKSSFGEEVRSWFDVVKLDPLEYNMRMRDRMGSKTPEVPEKEAENVCAKCGSKNFMRGDLDPEGREICALCKKRFYSDAAATS